MRNDLKSVYRSLWTFWISGTALIFLAVALVAYEIHIRTLFLSGWCIIAMLVGGIGLIATGLTCLWEVKNVLTK